MNRLEQLELAVLMILGLANVAAEVLGSGKTLVVVLGAFVWGGILFWGSHHIPRYLPERGLKKPGGEGWPQFLWGTAAGVVILLLAGAILGNFPIRPSFFWVVPLYFPWALVQQFFLCGVLLPRLGKLFPTPFAIVLAAVLFGASHLPDTYLAVFTLVAGMFWAWSYLRLQSIYPLALAHALLGALAYYLILGQDVGRRLLEEVAPMLPGLR